MATADKVTVELEAKRGKFDRDIEGARSKFEREMGRISGSAQQAERRIRASSGEIASSLRSLASGIAAGATVGAVTKLADTYTQLQNRLRVTGLEGAALERQYERLNAVATASRSGIEETVQVYSRLRLATEGIGLTNEDVTRTTEILAKSLSASGASASESAAALLQFSQAIGSGVLQGDELRSIRENAPAVARAIAKEFDTTVGGLKKLGEEGKLVSDRVIRAVLKSGTEIDALFDKTQATVGNALTNLGNQLINYIGQTDESLSASERLAGAINLLADNLDKLSGPIAALATFFGTVYVGSLVKASLATDGWITRSGAAIAGQIAGQRALTTATVLSTDARVAAIRAEIAAQTLMATTGRNSLGQFVSRTAATHALTAATGQLAAAQTAASRASLLASTGLVRGVGAAKALGSGLLALAGGPIGVAILAVAGLAAGIAFLIQRQSEAAVAARAEAKAKEALAPANTELEKLVRQLATANEAETKSIREKIAALVDEAKVKAANARQDYLVAKDEERRRQQRLSDSADKSGVNLVDAYGQPLARRGGVGPNGNPIDIVRETKELEELRAGAEALESAYSALADAARDATAPVGSVASAASGDGKGKKGKTAEQLAREAEQRARLLEDLEQQTRIEEANLAQNVARVRELEREAELVARIRQLKDAGVNDAEARASAIQARLDAARAADRERIAELQQRGVDLTVAELNENYELVRSLERQEELESLIEAHKKTSLSTTEAISKAEADLAVIEEARLYAAERYLKTQQSSHALRIAELTGNERLVKQLRDQEEIARRTAEYRQSGRLSPEQAEQQATNEVRAERSATAYGEQRDFFAATFSEGIRAAMSGDLQGFLSSQFGNLADMALRRLGESLFDSFSQAPAAVAQAQAEGVAQGAAISATVGPAIVTAGGTAATAMGTAILTSGVKAAALIAKASAVSSLPIPGFANGTRSSPGGLAFVGERGPELVNLPRGSQVIPNHQLRGFGSNQQPVVKLVVEESAYFAPRVSSIAGPIAVQASTVGVMYNADQATVANKRRGQSFIG